jgi:hypothetical protein
VYLIVLHVSLVILTYNVRDTATSYWNEDCDTFRSILSWILIFHGLETVSILIGIMIEESDFTSGCTFCYCLACPTVFKLILMFIFIFTDAEYENIPYNEMARAWIWLELLSVPVVLLFSLRTVAAVAYLMEAKIRNRQNKEEEEKEAEKEKQK